MATSFLSHLRPLCSNPLLNLHKPRLNCQCGNHPIPVLSLTRRFLSLAVLFEHASFFTPHSKMWVQGSWIRRAFWTVRAHDGRLLKIDLNAHHPKFKGSSAPATSKVADVSFAFDGKALTVRTPLWRTRAQVTRGAPHYGHLRMNVEVQPLYDTAADAVAPHGLLGETYDGDGRPLHGKRDSYERLDDGTQTRKRRGVGGMATTRAKAEGAIEGTAEMYRVKRPFDTNFSFSRFGATAARPRDAAKIRRRRVSA